MIKGLHKWEKDTELLYNCVCQEKTTAKVGEKCSTQSAPNRTVACKF